MMDRFDSGRSSQTPVGLLILQKKRIRLINLINVP
jgi:hypothetical protein